MDVDEIERCIRAAAAALAPLPKPPELLFVDKLDIEAQRDICKRLGGSTMCVPYGHSASDPRRFGVIEAMHAVVGQVVVQSQVFIEADYRERMP